MVCSKDEKNIKFTLVYSVFNIIPVLDQTEKKIAELHFLGRKKGYLFHETKSFV